MFESVHRKGRRRGRDGGSPWRHGTLSERSAFVPARLPPVIAPHFFRGETTKYGPGHVTLNCSIISPIAVATDHVVLVPFGKHSYWLSGICAGRYIVSRIEEFRARDCVFSSARAISRRDFRSGRQFRRSLHLLFVGARRRD